MQDISLPLNTTAISTRVTPQMISIIHLNVGQIFLKNGYFNSTSQQQQQQQQKQQQHKLASFEV